VGRSLNYEAVLEADAAFSYDDCVEGQAWRLTVQGEGLKIRTKARQHGKGPVVAEMRAIVDGLREAASHGVDSVIVKTDNRWCAHVLVGLWKPELPRTTSVANEAVELLTAFGAVAVIHTRTKTMRRIDRAARSAADNRRRELRQSATDRLHAVGETMSRAEKVKLHRATVGWTANGYFDVTVRPPSCTCPDWSLRWKGVPLAGKRARRNPCKHMVAAARAEGITRPEEILRLARSAVT
jgi:ribonuclease HI